MGAVFAFIPIQRGNSDIKPPLPVVDPERFYRSGEKTAKLWEIRNSNLNSRVNGLRPLPGLPDATRSAGGAVTAIVMQALQFLFRLK
jgi:hypothetical protein